MDLDTNQQRVFDEAKKRLTGKPWFKGVCMEDFPSEKECEESFDSSVEGVVMATEMYDNPNFFQFD